MSDDPSLTIPAARVVELATARRLATCVDEVRLKGFAFCNAMLARGYPVAVTQALRTDADQAKLYAMGRTTPSWDAGWPGRGKLGTPVTKAETAWDSPHGCGAAFDFAFLIDGVLVADKRGSKALSSWDDRHPWHLAGDVADTVGLDWGGRFDDKPHLQALKWRRFRRAA